MKTLTRFLVAAVPVLLLSSAPAYAASRHAQLDDGWIQDGTCQHSERNALADFGHDLGAIFKKAGEHVVDGAAESVGLVELLGVRYPVKKYQEQVSPTLWRGSRIDDSAGFADLKSRGFKATVDLTLEHTGDAKLAPANGLNTYNVPTLDDSHPTERQMVGFLNFVTNPANQPVYIHCEAGVGRTSIATAVYRMAVQGWSTDQALAEAKAHGMKLPNQIHFVEKFGADLAAGRIPGYPLAPGVSDGTSAAVQQQLAVGQAP